MTPKQKKTTYNAFTIIELLVVISIISMLMGILIPALNRAKMQAWQLVCQTRLYNWGIAFNLYTNDNKGFYPHADGWDKAKSDADNYGWVDVLPPYIEEKPFRDYPRFQRPGKDTLFQCPIAKPIEDNLTLRNGYYSYAMNSCLELDGDCFRPLNGPPGSNNMPSFLKVIYIKEPAKTILLFEQLLDPSKGYDGKDVINRPGAHAGGYPKAFSARHPRKQGGLGGSILFCDGHIEWKESVWKDEWPKKEDGITYDNFQAPARNDRNWFPY